ncbi:MAG: Glyoxalase/bleomycin resistance protein/dioxygenase, partial [Solirubrobacterales bacterium]|nr:Glyoxalase/bleomycin resistance protein/dioxygenase [Solirubrobacterales bacterium]
DAVCADARGVAAVLRARYGLAASRREISCPTGPRGARRVPLWQDPQVPLYHVAQTVSDRDRSAAFYGRHFALTERVHEDEHLLILGSPDGSLLALRSGPVPSDLPRTNHFGFQVADGDEVRRARERLREAGVPEAEWQDDGRFVRVQVTDPDGYRVELYAL